MDYAATVTPAHRPTILLADDDEGICTVISHALKKRGYGVKTMDNGRELVNWVARGVGDLVISDVIMPQQDGLDALTMIRDMQPELPVIIISAQSTLKTAVEATERGANEYFPKPFDLHQLTECVDRLLRNRKQENRATPSESHPADRLIGESPAMQQVYQTIVRLTRIDLTVLLEGESGTGKEVIARTLHQLSPRRDKPFIAINMAAIPKELAESELFGHEKGAFTGAHTTVKGKFSQAEGGTLFLDEIGDMPIDIQTKLLRVLQEGVYTPIGSRHTVRTNTRIICATHHNLEKLCRNNQFREDLYYRINVVPIKLPPLRERKEDITPLAEHFLVKATSKGLPRKTLSPEALVALQKHDWPGNIRELENLLYRLCALTQDPVISGDDIHAQLYQQENPTQKTTIFSNNYQETVTTLLEKYFASHQSALPPAGVYSRIIRLTEAPLITLALKATGGNQIKAAELLGINRNTLRKKISELDIPVDKQLQRPI